VLNAATQRITSSLAWKFFATNVVSCPWYMSNFQNKFAILLPSLPNKKIQ
jgi:hypothetical protein